MSSLTQARLVLCAIAGFGTIIACFCIPIMRENIIYCALSYLAVCGRALAPDYIFQGKEHMSPITIRYFVSKGVSTLLTFMVVHSFSDILWVPVLDIAASAIALSWSFAAAQKLFDVRIVRVSLARIVGDLKRSALYFISNMSSAIFTGFSTLLVGIALSDQNQIAFWSLSMTAVSAVQSLYSPIVNSLYPRMVVSGDFSFAKKLSLIAAPVVIVGTVCFALLSRPIMLLLGGADYAEGSGTLVLVSPLLFFSFFGMLYGWPVLGAAGKVKELTFTTVISALFSIAALLALSIAGMASILTIAIVRVFTEAAMCGLRLNACRSLRLELKEARE